MDLLGEIEAIQQAARKPIRGGARGGDIYVEPEAMLARSALIVSSLSFVAHGTRDLAGRGSAGSRIDIERCLFAA